MEFRVLGPLEVVDGGRPVELGGRRQHTLLAFLLVHANEAVAADRLLEELWPKGGTGANALQVSVSRLRRALPGDDRLLTRPPGYLLRVESGECDRDRFERLLEEGRQVLERGKAESAAAALREALSLWRGPPFADFLYDGFAQAEIARLEELRLVCLEERIEADLALGRHVELVGELEALTREQPLRQRPRAQLMLALYRSGRHADALAAYQATRRQLVDELGIEPSQAMRELEQAILRQDPELELTRQATKPDPPAAAEPVVEPPGLTQETVVRKHVTVLFCDLVGWTLLDEELDPEVLHALSARGFEEARGVLERHGGTAERVTGDAAVAVFGHPVLHEDDALRAVRAAVELREGLTSCSQAAGEGRFAVRIGIASGEVAAGVGESAHTLVTGDTVSLATRLQRVADPNTILLDEPTYRLVKDAVRVEPVEALALQVKGERTCAFRVLELLPHASGFTRHFDTPLVGREDELVVLRKAFERSVRERRCYLVTVYGLAGIGKTRLALELARGLGSDASVLTGRCLSYGEGITYWPVREMVTEAAGNRPIEELLAGEEDAEAVAARVAAAVGLAEGGGLAEETFWAFRRLAEALARRKPLVLVFEDLHWAAPTLLDLVEYVADWTRDAPMLLLCLARPELLEERPGWGGGRPTASSLLLEPLSKDEGETLLSSLPGGEALGKRRRARIAEASEGNPLFLEQMVAMLAERGDPGAELPVPPAIQALLAARLDRLDPAERRLIGCAAVEGEIFHVGAVSELSSEPERADLPARLSALVRRELLRPDKATVPGETAFRFRHALIREAAYNSLPKQRRAELHERYARWFEEALGARFAEGDEFLGYHLEQAYRYRSELGVVDVKAVELADRARVRLASAGRLALRRGDTHAAANLLERARALPSTDERSSLEVAPDLGFALFQAGELDRAEAILSDTIQRTGALGERPTERHAWVVRESFRLFWQADQMDLDESLREAQESLAVLGEAGNHSALARGWVLLWLLYMCRGEAALQREAAERAREHARLAGSRLDEAWALVQLGWTLVEGPTPVGEAIGILETLLHELADDPLGEAAASVHLANLLAMDGRLDDALALIARGRAEVQEFAVGYLRMNVEVFGAGRVEARTGNLDAAERTARAAAEHLAGIGDDWFYVIASNDLARAVCDQGRPSECLSILEESEQHPSPPDFEILVKRATTRALALARLGKLEEAEILARETVIYAGKTEFLGYHAEALLVLAEVLRLAGRPAEASSALEEAARLFEQKGNVVSAAKARASREDLAK